MPLCIEIHSLIRDPEFVHVPDLAFLRKRSISQRRKDAFGEDHAQNQPEVRVAEELRSVAIEEAHHILQQIVVNSLICHRTGNSKGVGKIDQGNK